MTKTRFYLSERCDWDIYVKQSVGPKYLKANKIICTALNIIVPIMLLFSFKLSFAEYILAFLIFDVSLTMIEYLSIGIYNASKNIKYAINIRRYRNDVSKMPAEDIARLKMEMNSNTEYYKEKVQILEQKIQEYKQATIVPKDKESIKYVEEVIRKLSMYMADAEEKFFIDKMGKILEASNKLLAAVKNDPSDGVRVVTVFNVYSEELLKILEQYEQLDEEARKEKKQKVKDLLSVFAEKLETLEERISSGKEQNFDFDVDYLMKKLKEGG